MEDVIIIVTMGSALVNPATQNQVQTQIFAFVFSQLI